MNELFNATTFDELLDIKYGKVGTPLRNDYDRRAYNFVISELLKDARKRVKITQQELADRIGTKKSYISRIESGKCDIQLSTLHRIVEHGLKMKMTILFD
jgi:DNA-binding XRE family transcriptional regulator